MADKAHRLTDEKTGRNGKAAVCHLFQSGKRNSEDSGTISAAEVM